MRCIGDDANNKAVEVKVEIEIRGWGTQWPEGLIAPDKKLELDK